MIETISLLQELRETPYEGAILTTFNCHLPFLEEVVIRRLQASGCRHIIVLADARQLAQAVASDPPRAAGRDYALIPVPSLRAFHPKIVLLAGPNRGFLAIGSHNLTLSGFGLNREVTNVFRHFVGKSEESHDSFRNVYSQLHEWMTRGEHDLDDHAFLRSIEQIAPWLRQGSHDKQESDSVLFSGPGKASLYHQLVPYLSNKIRSVTVAGAFYDQKLAFIRRLRDELRPSTLTVSVDPETVSMPAAAKNIKGVEFRRGTSLGPNKAKYLHAKLLYFTDGKSGHCLVSGSANPSAPAWLKAGSTANDEAIVIRTGHAAKRAAKKLGLQSVAAEPELDTDDWAQVRENWRDRQSDTDESHSAGVIALNVGADGELEVSLARRSKRVRLDLFTRDGWLEMRSADGSKGLLTITLPEGHTVCVLTVTIGKRCIQTILIHYAELLAERARSGLQRKFRGALSSLDSDSPDLAALFSCIEQVVFDSDSKARKPASGRNVDPATRKALPETLAISIEEIRHSKTRTRLTAGTDLGYFIDILIRALNADTVDYSEVDDFGRNEEERVGSDDADVERVKRTEATAAKVLALCHRKIRRLVKKAATLMVRFSSGKVTDRILVTRLMAVLGLLRQLRAHDRHTWWVNEQRGESTVPQDQLASLLESICNHLFESRLFGAKPESDDEVLVASDELARLRGLVFWLGSQCGLTLKLDSSFNESRKDKLTRLDSAARFLSLAEMVHGDSLSLAEAEESIGMTDATRRALLHRACQVADRVTKLTANEKTLAGAQAQAGDLVYHPKGLFTGCRIVLSATSNSIRFVARGGGEGRAFLADRLKCIPADYIL